MIQGIGLVLLMISYCYPLSWSITYNYSNDLQAMNVAGVYVIVSSLFVVWCCVVEEGERKIRKKTIPNTSSSRSGGKDRMKNSGERFMVTT